MKSSLPKWPVAVGSFAKAMRCVSVPTALILPVPFTWIVTPDATYTVVPGWMVSVIPAGTMRFAVTRYGPPAAVHVVLAASVPLAETTEASSYQTSNTRRSVSLLAPSKAWIRTLLMPGRSVTFGALHVASQAVQDAVTPFTLTERVVIAFAFPASAVFEVVVCG